MITSFLAESHSSSRHDHYTGDGIAFPVLDHTVLYSTDSTTQIKVVSIESETLYREKRQLCVKMFLIQIYFCHCCLGRYCDFNDFSSRWNRRFLEAAIQVLRTRKIMVDP